MNQDLNCYLYLQPDMEQLFVFAGIPNKIPVFFHYTVAEFVERVNFGKPIGNLQFDFGDGHIRYRINVSFVKSQLSKKWVENAVETAITEMNRCKPAIENILQRGYNASEALSMLPASAKTLEFTAADRLPGPRGLDVLGKRN